MNTGNNPFYILLGAVISLATTGFAIYLRNKNERDAKEQNFKQITKQEVKGITRSLDKLKTVYNLKYYFDYSVLKSLDKRVSNLESIRNDSIYIKNKDLQEQFNDLLTELPDYLYSVRLLQDLFYNQQRALANDRLNVAKIKKGVVIKEATFNNDKENNDAFQQTSTQKLIDLVEINRNLDELDNLLIK